MVRLANDLEYLKTITPIKNYLRDTPKSEKSIKTYLQSFDKIFGFLMDRFRENIDELKKYDKTELDNIIEVLSQLNNVNQKNHLKKELTKLDIPNKVFNEWRNLNPNKKADILMKWAKTTSETNGNANKNTYLNYIWRIQGLLSKLGRDYEANPKNLDQISGNGFHLEDDITYEEVLILFEKLSPKYKLILKIMMYSGLNPIDIIQLKPVDFKPYKGYYVVIKEREKTKHKNVEFLITFEKSFVDEIKSYFERKIIKHYKKDDKKFQHKIEQFKINSNYEIIEDKPKYVKFEGQYNWIKDKNTNLFGDIKSKTVSDTFVYHVSKNNLNSALIPMNIRRLCFTRLLDVFSLRDNDIYQLWTQHKAGIITKHYTLNLLDRTIPYFQRGKIQDAVLIGDTEGYIREIDNLRKNGINKIKELEQQVNDLKQISKILIEMKREEDRIEEAKGIKFGKEYKMAMEVLEDRVNKLYKKELDKEE